MFIANVAPQETPLLSGLRQVKAQTGYVEWLEDTLPARAFNAVLEGIAFTDMSCSMPVRRYASVQTFYKSGVVSDSERNVEHAGFDDPFTYQENKKFLETKCDIEHALHRGSAATGATNAYSQLAGMLNLLSTNFTNMVVAGADSNWTGVTLTEAIFNNILELVYQNGTVQPQEVYCNSKIKRSISGFNTKTTFNIDAADRRQVLATDWYVSDFGDLRIYLSRDQARKADGLAHGTYAQYVSQTGALDPAYDQSFIVLDPSYFMTGWLQTVRRETLSRDGLRDRFQMSAQLTLIARSEKAGGGARGLIANI